MPPPASRARAGAVRWAPAAALAALALLYLRTLGLPSLWLDEAWEACYYVGILAEPWYNRPALYMLAERALVRLLGPSELVLRLLPCLAGLGAVAATYRLAREEAGEEAGWFAAGLLALSPSFLFHAHALKSYTLDALFTVLLLLAYRAYAADRSPRRLGLYASVAALSFGFSFTGVFAVAALAVVEAAARRREPRALLPFALAHAALAALFAALFATLYSKGAGDELLRGYFVEFYPPVGSPPALLPWIARRTAGALADVTGLGSGIAASLLVGAGLRHLALARGGAVAWALPLLLAVNLGAASVELYPYGVERLSLYLAPLACLAVAAAVAAVLPRGRTARLAGGLALAGLLYPLLHSSLVAAGPYLATGWTQEHIRPLVAYLSERREPGEAIYVSEGAAPAFRYYWWRSGRDPADPEVVRGERHRLRPQEHAAQVDAIASRHARLWCLYGHLPPEELAALRELFGRRYETVESVTRRDVTLDLLARREGQAGAR